MYRVPWKGTGLCLAATAIQGPRAALLWLHRPTHQGCMTSTLSHLTEDTPMMNRKQSYIWRWYDLQHTNGIRRPRVFSPSMGSCTERQATRDWKGTRRPTVSLLLREVPKPQLYEAKEVSTCQYGKETSKNRTSGCARLGSGQQHERGVGDCH
jgi:hypothetical protein